METTNYSLPEFSSTSSIDLIGVHNAAMQIIDTKLKSIESQVSDYNAQAAKGSNPTFVNSVSDMTNSGTVYVLNTNGHIYSWNGTKFADSGLTYTSSANGLIIGSNYNTGTINLDNLPLNSVTTMYYATPSDNPLPYDFSQIRQWIVFTIGTSQIKYQLASASGYMLTRSYSSNTWYEWHDQRQFMSGAWSIDTGFTKAAMNSAQFMIYLAGTTVPDCPFDDEIWPGGYGMLLTTGYMYNKNTVQIYIHNDTVKGFQVFGRYAQNYEKLNDANWHVWFDNTLFATVDYVDNAVANISISTVPQTFVVDASGSGDYTSVKAAIDYVNSKHLEDATIYIKPGTYDIIEEWGGVDYLDAHSNMNGISLQNSIHIIGYPGAKLVCNYTGDNTDVQNNFSVFNMPYGSQYAKGFTLENVWVEGSKIRYIVHDDNFGNSVPYSNVFKNCHFVKDCTNDSASGATGGIFYQCIGGGFGQNCNIRIENSYFKSIITVTESFPKYGTIYPVTYHNATSGDPLGALYISDCYFDCDDDHKASCAILATSATTTKKSPLYATGNSVEVAIPTQSSSANVETFAWGNEIRS